MTNENDKAKLRNWFFHKLDAEQRVSFISICLPLDESLARNLTTEMMFRVFDDICGRLDIVHPTLPMPEGFIDPLAPDAAEQLQAALDRPVAGGKDRCWAFQQESRDHRNNCPVCQRAVDDGGGDARQ